jgi:hypothetical protein
MAAALHPFIDLAETDRTRWLAALFDLPGSPPPYGVRYPMLRAGESPYSWLCDQFRRAGEIQGARDRIRRSVVEILRTGALRETVRDRAQVLGQLLEVAGTCGFQDELEETLRGWISTNAYALDSYRLDMETVPLRRTVWAILIAWRGTKELVKFLKRDFSSGVGGSAQLCFAELGRLVPDSAIRRIPEILSWPEPYWRETLHGFLSQLGARAVLSRAHKAAWTDCVADIYFDSGKLDLLTGDPAPLGEVLGEAGIFYDRRAGSFGTLSLIGNPAVHIKIDSAPVKKSWDEDLTTSINQLMTLGIGAAPLFG